LRWSSEYAKQSSGAPSCAGAKQGNEKHSDHTARNGAFAPALEHSHESNDEQQDCARTEKFEHHESLRIRRTINILPLVRKEVSDGCHA